MVYVVSMYCSAVGWMAAVVSLNEQRAGPRFKRGEGVAGACSDGELPAVPNDIITYPHISHRVYGQFLCCDVGTVQAVLCQ